MAVVAETAGGAIIIFVVCALLASNVSAESSANCFELVVKSTEGLGAQIMRSRNVLLMKQLHNHTVCLNVGRSPHGYEPAKKLKLNCRCPRAKWRYLTIEEQALIERYVEARCDGADATYPTFLESGRSYVAKSHFYYGDRLLCLRKTIRKLLDLNRARCDNKQIVAVYHYRRGDIKAGHFYERHKTMHPHEARQVLDLIRAQIPIQLTVISQISEIAAAKLRRLLEYDKLVRTNDINVALMTTECADILLTGGSGFSAIMSATSYAKLHVISVNSSHKFENPDWRISVRSDTLRKLDMKALFRSRLPAAG
ncbi:hypothetical protein FVE85_4760 [Porphyridium purpureum]|uniref:Uncharacterized protein n=1 Tax=Porphyridium purpureum TaxID=35688 RepID=A0A5J4YS38_PORPP|nr:hypothetical protein FVE85_4760 [Porphyridium purpureum]|eukprot:POR2858..scf236_6